MRRHNWMTLANRRLGRVVLSVLFTGFSAAPALAQPQDSERTPLSTSDIASRVTSSVVTLTTPTSTGSGVIVDTSGVLLTSLHVVQGDIEVAVELANGDVYDDVAVVDVDERRDLVLLKIKAFNLTAASLGNSDDVQVGEDVVLVGSPRGLDLTVSEGVISAIRDSGDGYRLFQTSAPASSGSSGGGMFNAYGELVGVVTSQVTDGQNLNFAVPINYARGLLATETTMTLTELAERVGSSDTSSSTRVQTGTATNAIDPASVARLSEIVEASGLDFEQSSDDFWFTSFSGGDYLDEVQVLVNVGDPPALPGRPSVFDVSGSNVRNSPREPLKHHAGESSMNNYRSLNHTKWECQYHVVFIPKYRRKTLYGGLRHYLGDVLRRLAEQRESRVEEGHLLADHVHMLVSIPPKYSVAQVIGYIKGKSAIHIAREFAGRPRNFVGQHFWARGYYVSTVGQDERVVREYVQQQEREDRRLEQLRLEE